MPFDINKIIEAAKELGIEIVDGNGVDCVTFVDEKGVTTGKVTYEEMTELIKDTFK